MLINANKQKTIRLRKRYRRSQGIVERIYRTMKEEEVMLLSKT